MESAVIIYHKNALNYCQHRWLKKCLDTIEKQTYQNFDVFEVTYGDKPDEQSIVKYFNKLQDKKLFYFHEPMPDHSYAMNFLANKVFAEGTSYKYCFNINIDDFYDLTRFERQIKIIKKLKYDLVSSNMWYVDEEDNVKLHLKHLAHRFVSTKKIPLKKQIELEQDYIKKEFLKNHNIISHPCVCYTRRFWRKVGPYKHIVPREDMLLFREAALNPDIKMHIAQKCLIYYRIHNTQTVSEESRNNDASALDVMMVEALEAQKQKAIIKAKAQIKAGKF